MKNYFSSLAFLNPKIVPNPATIATTAATKVLFDVVPVFGSVSACSDFT